MTIRFRVTPSMLYRARRAVMRHTKWMNFGGLFILVIFPIVMLAVNMAYGFAVADVVRSDGVIYLGLVLLWLVLIPLLTRWSSARTLRATPSFQGELEYSFSETGVQVRSVVSAAQLSWATFVRAVETKEFFLLFHNNNIASFLPKAAFGGADEQENFRSLVRSQLGDRARSAGVGAAGRAER